jgi:hypothetical protein
MARPKNAASDSKLWITRDGRQTVLDFTALGVRLRTKRKKQRHKLMYLAEQLSINVSTLSRIENGEHIPNPQVLEQIIWYVFQTKDYSQTAPYAPLSGEALLQNHLEHDPQLNAAAREQLLLLYRQLTKKEN